MPRRLLNRRCVAVLAAALAAGLCLPAAASAHGIVGKADLPIPVGWFIVAAAIVLVVSFVALAGGWTKPRLEHPSERPLFRVGMVPDVICGVLGIFFFVVTVYAALAGSAITQANLAPTAVFVDFWVGIPFLSLLFGPIWRLFSPWRAIGRGVGWTIKKFSDPDAVPDPIEYPRWLGYWPAVIGLFAFGWLELVWQDRPTSSLGVIALIYLVVQLVGMSIYGVEQWTRRGDAFEAYSGLFGRLAPLGRRAGVLVLRNPLAGLGREPVEPGFVGFVLLGIAVTSFDGLSNGSTFLKNIGHVQNFFHDSIGFSIQDALYAGYTVGLLVAILIVVALFAVGAWGVGKLPSGERAVRVFAGTLIPIVCAYFVAHYFSLLAYNGQANAYLASDPLGDGSNLFGSANDTIDYSIITVNGIWYVQLTALVIGHVLGLTLAHDRALSETGSTRAATRSQIVMLVVMVAFTVFGLWLLSEANKG